MTIRILQGDCREVLPTLEAAELEGFTGTGIELSPEYVEIAKRRIAGDAPLFAQVSA